jgi:tetraacyldisaccharide 4'-kinase
MRIRRWMYDAHLLGVQKVSVPVICVGNLTCGGTGKTPTVAWVVDALKQQGRRPAILTRGYHAIEGQSDEATWLADRTDCPVIIQGDRLAGAREAIAQGADVLVMDDGFQHQRLARDRNLVLIDATAPFGGGACLPLGRLREPRSALRAADAILITRSDQVPPERVEWIRGQLSQWAPQAKIALSCHAPVGWVSPSGESLPVDALKGESVMAFCGLGNADAFYRTLESTGVKLAGQRSFRDHAGYSPERIHPLRTQADSQNAKLVTTEKDGAKLSSLLETYSIYQLSVSLTVMEGRSSLLDRILDIF